MCNIENTKNKNFQQTKISLFSGPKSKTKKYFHFCTNLNCSFGDGVQYPVLAKHLPENVAPGPAYYESMGHSIVANRIDNNIDDDEGIENIMLENGIAKSDSLTNVSAVSTKASTGALLANEGDDNLSVSSSQRNSRTSNNVNHNNSSSLNGTVMTDVSIPIPNV